MGRAFFVLSLSRPAISPISSGCGIIRQWTASGLDRVDHIVLSSATADQPATHTVFVVQAPYEADGAFNTFLDPRKQVSHD